MKALFEERKYKRGKDDTKTHEILLVMLFGPSKERS
jgi:hypothetical protein